MGRNYHEQHFDQECGNCKHIDSIKERNVPGDISKQKYYVCSIGPHKIQVQKVGVCDIWTRKERK